MRPSHKSLLNAPTDDYNARQGFPISLTFKRADYFCMLLRNVLVSVPALPPPKAVISYQLSATYCYLQVHSYHL
jgi:hypothetical protein